MASASEAQRVKKAGGFVELGLVQGKLSTTRALGSAQVRGPEHQPAQLFTTTAQSSTKIRTPLAIVCCPPNQRSSWRNWIRAPNFCCWHQTAYLKRCGFFFFQPFTCSKFLFASPQLTRREIYKFVVDHQRTKDVTLDATAAALIEHAVNAGASDSISVVLCGFKFKRADGQMTVALRSASGDVQRVNLADTGVGGLSEMSEASISRSVAPLGDESDSRDDLWRRYDDRTEPDSSYEEERIRDSSS